MSTTTIYFIISLYTAIHSHLRTHDSPWLHRSLCCRLLTVCCDGLLLGLGGVGGAPDDVAAVGVRAHELRAVAVPRQALQLLHNTQDHKAVTSHQYGSSHKPVKPTYAVATNQKLFNRMDAYRYCRMTIMKIINMRTNTTPKTYITKLRRKYWRLSDIRTIASVLEFMDKNYMVYSLAGGCGCCCHLM